ncbi:hypothetical protein HHL22_08035 [Hymenobacter sp. RP-2-7]|uniref:Uncharacterized protein n=1 Tax=Hymenobacter polaris TaxID=2682546 RepID=A0A7Y0AD55_9BACT|nr:hypothetical protein [Hymenobacter polaris]NML65152.1 hypothetical protein [Hymenobacter polaris]
MRYTKQGGGFRESTAATKQPAALFSGRLSPTRNDVLASNPLFGVLAISLVAESMDY